MDEKFYNLLADLREFVREHSIDVEETGKKDAPPGPQAPPAAEEKRQPEGPVLFREAMEGVRRVPPGKGRVPRARKPGRPPAASDREQLEETLREEYIFNVVDLPEYMEGRVDDVNPVTMDKLQAGEFSAQAVLDLHGLGADEASRAFQEFVDQARLNNMTCIKIIHGRGLKSRRGPVLKEKLKEWIVRAMYRKWVVAFASCPMAGGGPGATVILLRNRPRKQRLTIIG